MVYLAIIVALFLLYTWRRQKQSPLRLWLSGFLFGLAVMLLW